MKHDIHGQIAFPELNISQGTPKCQKGPLVSYIHTTCMQGNELLIYTPTGVVAKMAMD